MEWKLIEAGIWSCQGTDVTIHYIPDQSPLVPYRLRWKDKEHGCSLYRNEIFKQAEAFIGELVSAGIDA